MVVDAEFGMPLNLSKWECLWEEDADDSGQPVRIHVRDHVKLMGLRVVGLNPDPTNLPPLDPKDAFLLGDSSTGSYANGSSTSTPLAHVPWLRKTEYISREGSQRSINHEPYVFSLLTLTDAKR